MIKEMAKKLTQGLEKALESLWRVRRQAQQH